MSSFQVLWSNMIWSSAWKGTIEMIEFNQYQEQEDRWLKNDEVFLKSCNFEDPHGPGEDVVQVAHLLLLKELRRVNLRPQHLVIEQREF